MEKYSGLEYRIVPGTPQAEVFRLLFLIPKLSSLLIENDMLVCWLFWHLNCKGVFYCSALKSGREMILYSSVILVLKEIPSWILWLFLLTSSTKGVLSGILAVWIDAQIWKVQSHSLGISVLTIWKSRISALQSKNQLFFSFPLWANVSIYLNFPVFQHLCCGF